MLIHVCKFYLSFHGNTHSHLSLWDVFFCVASHRRKMRKRIKEKGKRKKEREARESERGNLSLSLSLLPYFLTFLLSYLYLYFLACLLACLPGERKKRERNKIYKVHQYLGEVQFQNQEPKIPIFFIFFGGGVIVA